MHPKVGSGQNRAALQLLAPLLAPHLKQGEGKVALYARGRVALRGSASVHAVGCNHA